MPLGTGITLAVQSSNAPHSQQHQDNTAYESMLRPSPRLAPSASQCQSPNLSAKEKPLSPQQPQKHRRAQSLSTAEGSACRVMARSQDMHLPPLPPLLPISTYGATPDENHRSNNSIVIGGHGLSRPIQGHRSPNRQKWSPLIYTIVEAQESFSASAIPAKLFGDDRENSGQLNSENQCGMDAKVGHDAHGPLAPSLEPNTAAPSGCRGNEEAVITLDVLLREICRLSTHDFSGPWRAASYPSVLEPLYQRLSDYHVCLRSARRRPAGTQSSRLNSMSSTSEIWTLTKDPELPKDSVSTPITDAQKTARLRERIVDLETQLVQSRRAHHTLLREHILSFTEAKASTIIASNMLSTAPVNVALTETDATAIQTILASVSNVATESSVTEAGPDTLSIQSSLLTTSQISLQDAIKSTTDRLHSKQRSDLPLRRTLGSRDRQAAGNYNGNDSDACLISLKDHPMLFTEATTRLLRAETELGLLKLVMAQNQKEVSGIEEEVFQKQAQLVHHRRIFDSLLELNHLDNETQAWEAGVMIQQLELQVQELQQDKENMARVVSSLELEVRGLQELLDKKREDHRVQQPLMADQLQNQETIVAHLRSELETQTLRVSEMEQLSVQDQEELDVTRIKLQKALDGDGAMVEHIEKEHKKKTSVLRSNLAQAQKTSKRLEKEISTLAVKIVRVESLNDELMEQGEKDRAEIKEMTRQVELLQSQLDSVTLRSSSPSVTSTQDSATEAALREQITMLEIQVEELSESLRLKDLSLEQAHEETERLTLQLEHDLAQQTEVHVREMAAFAEEKKLQAQRERSCQNASITLFQNMVGKLQTELSDTQEKMRDISICWGHTKDQLQKCEQSYRRRKKDLEETTKHLREVEETVLKLGDAIGMLEAEKEANLELVQALAKKDRELNDMKYRLRALEEDE